MGHAQQKHIWHALAGRCRARHLGQASLQSVAPLRAGHVAQILCRGEHGGGHVGTTLVPPTERAIAAKRVLAVFLGRDRDMVPSALLGHAAGYAVSGKRDDFGLILAV
jgi:hypothetical protein